ncbi:hypothetical protein D9611_011872 [Ephemerocybe angulata]|uniref:Uncharacterized protein n=1 Tax=Ephemerocybe angulata TaxID=980116 RepID=A0A8H5BZH9_9AGAR|nr:hypothetical protein D9611_011872 [Tulosesus angulatus]
MPVATRHGSSEQLEAELRRLQIEAQDHHNTLAQIAAQRAKLEKMKHKAEEDARAAMRAQKALERKAAAQKELQKQKRRPTMKERELDALEIIWEVMGDEGECERCRELGIDCLRMDIAEHRSVKATNVQRVWIGNTAYSKCQECKLHSGKCEIVEVVTDGASDDAIVKDLVRVGEKRKIMGQHDGKERAVKRKMVNVKQEVPEVIIPSFRRPAVVGRGTFVQGSSSGTRTKQTYRNEEVEELAARLEQDQTRIRDDLAALRMEQVGFRAALAQLEQRM